MFGFFRIFFCILSALCVAAVIPVGAFLGFTYALFFGLGAAVFFALTVFCKNEQEKRNPQANDEDIHEES